MKFLEPEDNTRPFVIELTKRNLETLLGKLSDPLSARTLEDPTGRILVRAVQNEEHYSDRSPGEVCKSKTHDVLIDFGNFIVTEVSGFNSSLSEEDLESIVEEYMSNLAP